MPAKACEDGDDNRAVELTAKASELLDWANKGEQPASTASPKAD